MSIGSVFSPSSAFAARVRGTPFAGGVAAADALFGTGRRPAAPGSDTVQRGVDAARTPAGRRNTLSSASVRAGGTLAGGYTGQTLGG